MVSRVKKFSSRVKVKVVHLYSAFTRSVSKALRYSTHCQGITQFYLHTLRLIRKRNEPYLPHVFPAAAGTHLPTRRDGRPSRHWCEVAPAEIQSCDLPTANRHATTQPLAHRVVWSPSKNLVCVCYTTSAHVGGPKNSGDDGPRPLGWRHRNTLLPACVITPNFVAVS